VLVVSAPSLDELVAPIAPIAPIARFVVSVGTNEPERVRPVAPPHARVVPLGRMQRPAFDGPVDRRS
jgi:hypothetical protein